ncbi:hypothetical protein CAI21_01490 [Alkalilimnicola ehrlichii]|uniref:Phage tail assembly chaperone-like domain-containing protein n=2 Tax=Alkalilimnicola ehrlichii TaxID=351052 RepID=A0A3E0X458_9GAMM|nr:hypothetical protein CAI21_01490 [Alkalilimnicola ehrlichii]RFA39630.1 hypothetical protein CAL65_00920 [Alkalilimnicola ehrlichii]
MITVDGVALSVDLSFLPIEVWSVHSVDGEPDIYLRDIWQHKSEDPDDLVGQCVAAWDAELAHLEQQRKTAEEAWLNSWGRVREERNALITETDWMIFPDSPLSDSERDEVKIYRQALRDIPQHFSAPLEVVWPENRK